MKKPHLGVSGILIENNRVLLGLRQDTDKSLPGMWCSPGGGVEFGELLVDALRREFKEEVKLDIRIGLGAFVDSIQQRITGDTHSVLLFFMVDRLGRKDPKPGPEFKRIGWFAPDSVNVLRDAGLITSMTYRALIHSNFFH